MTDENNGQAAADWYPQDDGTQRYWNGSQWTEHTAPGAGDATTTAVQPRSSGTPKWLIPLVACLALGFIAIAIGAIAGGTDEAEAEPTTTTAPATTEAATTTEPPPVGLTADEVLEAFMAEGLDPPNVRDTTDGNCGGEDGLDCSTWLTSDILTIISWDTARDARAWAEGPLDAVVVDKTATVHFQEGGTTPPYDRAAYEAVIAELNGEPAPVVAPTTTTTAPPATTTAPPPPPTTTAPPPPTTTAPPPPPPPPPPTTAAPPPPPPAPSAYYENCDAARAAGAAPVRVGDPGYAAHLDRDGDGVGCE